MPEANGSVLVAVDFSDESEAAVLWAMDYVENTDRALKILHVAHEPPDTPGFYRADPDDLLLPLKEVAGKYLTEFFAHLCQEHPNRTALRMAEPLLVEGTPPDRIVQVAAKVDADMIVLGNRGLTGLPHLLLGSTALNVAQHSPIPVTIVKAGKAADEI